MDWHQPEGRFTNPIRLGLVGGITMRCREPVSFAKTPSGDQVVDRLVLIRPHLGSMITLLLLSWSEILCLLLIRPIGSGRSPEVFVMEPTHAGHLHHPAPARRLTTPFPIVTRDHTLTALFRARSP